MNAFDCASERPPMSDGSGRHPIIPPPDRHATTLSVKSPSAETQREMVRVTLDLPFMDDDPVTEVVRVTEIEEPVHASTARDRAVLLRMDGVQAGEPLALDRLPLEIGRHGSCAIRIQDAGVSRRHARISLEGDAHFIEDLGSSNGTLVQGQSVIRRRLADGDLVQIGPRVAFRYAMTDLTQELLLKRLYESSTRDALTGAYNRKHFDERLRSELAFALRHRTELAVIVFDVDLFKRINDGWGHPAGDAVLRQIAQLGLRRLRSEDVLCRIGGEEFGVVLRSTDRTAATVVAERLRTTIGTLPVVYQGRTIPVTISVGVATLACCAGSASTDALLTLADRRLYAAKREGRNRVVSND